MYVCVCIRCAPLNFVIALLKFSVRSHCAPSKKKLVWNPVPYIELPIIPDSAPVSRHQFLHNM